LAPRHENALGHPAVPQRQWEGGDCGPLGRLAAYSVLLGTTTLLRSLLEIARREAHRVPRKPASMIGSVKSEDR
jgi:hypothetical protein